MALDVHLTTEGNEKFGEWPRCQFDESEHRHIFDDGKIDLHRYPMLQRMQDYYADARYLGDDIHRLAGELAEVLPAFENQPKSHELLSRFREVCLDAIAQGKILYCLCD